MLLPAKTDTILHEHEHLQSSPYLFCSHVHIFDSLSCGCSGRDRQVARAACGVRLCGLHTFCAHCMSIKWSAVRPGHFWIPSACDNSQACRVSGMHIHHKYGILWHSDLIWLCEVMSQSLSEVWYG
jgi:hypothetical protein